MTIHMHGANIAFDEHGSFVIADANILELVKAGLDVSPFGPTPDSENTICSLNNLCSNIGCSTLNTNCNNNHDCGDLGCF